MRPYNGRLDANIAFALNDHHDPLMGNIFLFTGENSYALREEKKRWIGEFVKKYGEENLLRITGKNFTFRQLLDEIAVAPFIAERRLVVVDGLPTLSKEEVTLLTDHIHPQTVLLFIEQKIDKRLAVSKQLLDVAEVKEFLPLRGKALLSWMQAFLKDEGATMEQSAAALLVEMLGEDQDMLSEELRKLALYAAGRPVTRADVDMMTLPSFEGVVWTLTDLLSAGRHDAALLYAHRYVERGGDPYGLWAVLLGMLRTLVAVNVAVRDGQRDARDIASDLQIHFLAVRGVLSYASKISPDALDRFLERSIDADIGLKTGGFRATDEAPVELFALIDRFILSAPR